MDRLGQYADALAAYEGWLGRQRAGEAEPEDRFLSAHEELREVLESMLIAQPTAAADSDPGSLSPPARPWVGLPDEQEQFGPYRIVRALGQGGMGVVYLAEDTRLERKVALKILPPERLYSSVAKQRFWREAKFASKLDHPNICPLFDVGEVDGLPFMAMRYIEGETLAELIARSRGAQVELGATPAGIDEILQMIELVARALHAAHELGVIHRDIKPPNIMITPDQTPIVLDFGIARDETALGGSLTMTGDLPGTPLYMSPEQVAPSGRQLDRTTDVYSLGATLYECLTLRPIAEGQTIRELFEAILRADQTPVTGLNRAVPRDVGIVVAKATDRDRERRYRTALEFAEDLRRARENEPIRARPAGPVLRARRWSQRNPVLAVFLPTLVVGLGVVLALYIDREQGWTRFGLVARAEQLDQVSAALLDAFVRWPDHAEPLSEWVQAAEDLVGSLPELRTFRAELLARGTADPRDAFLLRTIDELDPALVQFASDAGDLGRARGHLEWARRVADESIGAYAEEWRHARSSIRASSKYGHLDLEPQVGLVPLRENPETELWEFWHIRSGSAPVEREDGEFEIAPETGLVFVLIPEGTFWMGAQDRDKSGPNFDEGARAEESRKGRAFRMQVGAFFLSKYEMTRGQWQRLTGGDDPSRIRTGSRLPPPLTFRYVAITTGKIEVFEDNPVENVSWTECRNLLVQFGLELPAEAQWEYACRAETDTPWWTGPGKHSLSGRVNIADKTASRWAKWTEIDKEIDDGWYVHAPVDLFEPNGFGLYHILGNVAEWCADAYAPYGETPVESGGGLTRVNRGGAFHQAPNQSRCSFRRQNSPDSHENALGLRPARRIR